MQKMKKPDKKQYNEAKSLLLSDEEFKLVMDGKTQFREVIEDTVQAFKGGKPQSLILSGISTTVKEIKLKNKTGDVFYLQEEFMPDYVYGKGIIFKTAMINNMPIASQRIKFKPASQMPKEHARYFLVTTGVRVERLQDITLTDIKNEGIDIEDRLKDMDYFHSLAQMHNKNWAKNIEANKDLAEHYDELSKKHYVTVKKIKTEIFDKWINLWNSTHPDGQKWEDNPYVEVATKELVKKKTK